jgi:hypothetical protein
MSRSRDSSLSALAQLGETWRAHTGAIMKSTSRWHAGPAEAAAAHGRRALQGVLAVQLLGLLCALWLGLAGGAQAAGSDPPARVGHPALLAGTVELSWDGGEHWEPAVAGAPLTTGTAVRTAVQSRAELRVGSNALRLGVQSELLFEQLDDQAVVVTLRQGRLNLRWREASPGDRLVLQGEGLKLQAQGPAQLHLDVDAAHQRVVARVFEGAASFQVGATALPLAAGQQAVADARAQAVLQQGAAEKLPVDEWGERRDARAELKAERGQTAQFTPAEMTGAALLDGHGVWRTDPRFGPVWFPRAVGNDWAPYRFGRWAWVSPWGWTWIDDAPWGFAPFHYGRWVFLAGRWGWLPGGAAARPVYAPALVGFYGNPPGGWGPNVNVDVVGWYPLGPGEFYRPALAGGTPGAGYVQALNAPHVPNVATAAAHPASAAHNHRYAQTSFAATVVPQAAFAGGAGLAAARLDVAPGTLAGAPALGSTGLPAALRVPRRPGLAATARAAPAEPAAAAGAKAGRAERPLLKHLKERRERRTRPDQP